MTPPEAKARYLVGKRAAAVFLTFAAAYFLSALLRAVTATLAPVFSAELGLGAAEMGLLAGTYFLGFSAMQLPLGHGLDRFGPKRVLVGLLILAIAGCLAFASATNVAQLMVARCVIGMGVSACLMAPLTMFRRQFSASNQLRANSWLLMTGSLGMLASTLPAQWLLPVIGWRGLFAAVAVLMALATMAIAWVVPTDTPEQPLDGPDDSGYAAVFRSPAFRLFALPGLFSYGGLIAIQSLWAGPWLTEVSGRTAAQAAEGLFAINLCMLFAFLAWGAVMPRLAHAGLHARHMITWGLPASILVLCLIVALGPAAGTWHWALWCVLSTCVSLSQPAVGQAFPPAWAGRALSAFNLLIFGGVFCLQWGIGLVIDGLGTLGWTRVASFQGAMGLFALCCTVAQLWFLWRQRRMVIMPAEPAHR